MIGKFLRGWQMDVLKGHPQGADPRAFLEGVEPLIQKKLEEELKALKGGLKFQLALKVDLVKASPDGSEEYTDPVLRHKQEAVLQKSEIKELSTKHSRGCRKPLKSGPKEALAGL